MVPTIPGAVPLNRWVTGPVLRAQRRRILASCSRGGIVEGRQANFLVRRSRRVSLIRDPAQVPRGRLKILAVPFLLIPLFRHTIVM